MNSLKRSGSVRSHNSDPEPSKHFVGAQTALKSWLMGTQQDQLKGELQGPHGKRSAGEAGHPWWKVMCLSGVDYFSTLGYQPAIAALALEIRDITGQVPHIYLDWAAGKPIKNYLAFLLFGQGQIASTTHEVLRRAERDLYRRPVVHVS